MDQDGTPLPAPDAQMAECVIDALAPVFGLTIDPAWRGEVIAHWLATARAAALVLDFPLDDEVEPAPVFRA